VTLDDIINEMNRMISLGERELAEAKLQKARDFINNGGEMDGQQYDRLRAGHRAIKRLLVEQVPELQPTELIPSHD